jgi:hypothetical protein
LVGSEALRGETDAVAGSVTTVALAPPQSSPLTTPIAVAPAPSEPVAPIANMTPAPAESPPARARPFWTSTRVLGTVVGVTGLVSLGVGVGFAIQANQDADRGSSLASTLGPSGCLFAQSPSCRDLRSARDDQSRDHTLNLVFVSVGAAAVVAGAALILWPVHSRSRTALTPAVVVGGGGLQLQGEM